MSTISNLEEIVRSVANSIASQYHTSVKWVDLFAKQSDMRDHQEIRIQHQVVNTNYGNPVELKRDDSFVFSQTGQNGGPLPSTAQFSKSHTTTSTFSWTIEEGLSLTTTEKITVGASLPGLAKAESETTVSGTVSLSATQQQTDTVTETWTVQQTVTLAPMLRTDMTWVVNQVEVDAPFTVNVSVIGSVAIWFNDKIEYKGVGPSGGKHWLWFFPISAIAILANKPSFTPKGTYEAIFRCYGRFSGVGATTAELFIKTFPLGEPVEHPRVFAMANRAAAEVTFRGPSLIPVFEKQPLPQDRPAVLVDAVGVN